MSRSIPNPIAPSSVQEAAAERAIIAAPPSQEEFDAAMSAAADAVLTLINASPHTPTSDEIREMIETTMRKRFDAAQEKEEEEAPITGPVSINFDWEGHHHNLQIFNIGLSLLAKDDAGLREGIRKMLRGELAGEAESDSLDRLLADLETCEEKFGAMAHFAGVAKARFALQALRIAGQPSARHGELTQTVLQAGGQKS